MRMVKKGISRPILALAIVLVVAIVGAGIYLAMPAPAPPKQPVVVEVALADRPTTLDMTDTAIAGMTVANHLYDRLVEFDQNLNIVPGLATSWGVSLNQLTWTFNLRQNVKFQDGTAFNASAVKYNFDRLIDPINRNFTSKVYSRYWKVIQTVTVIDANTVAFTLTAPNSPFLYSLAFPNVGGISSPTALKNGTFADYTNHPVGTGPFKVVNYVPGSLIEMEAFNDYWGGRPQIDKLIFRVTSDPSTRVAAIQSGDVQVSEFLPLSSLTELRANSQINVTIKALDYRTYLINSGKYSKLVRQAINYAVNKEAIINGLFQGKAQLLRSPVGTTVAYAIGENTPYPYDQAKARQLLAQAGYPNGLNVTIRTTSGRYMYDKEVTEAIQAQLAEVGIKVDIIVDEARTHMAMLGSSTLMRNDTIIGNIGWGAGSGDPHADIIGSFFAQGAFYSAYYTNTTVQTLITQATQESNVAAREQLYRRIYNMLWEDAPMVWLFMGPCILSTDTNLKGVVLMPNESLNLRNAYIVE